MATDGRLLSAAELESKKAAAWERAEGELLEPSEQVTDALTEALQAYHTHGYMAGIDAQAERIAALEAERDHAINQLDEVASALGKRFGVDRTTVSMIVRGKTWK